MTATAPNAAPARRRSPSTKAGLVAAAAALFAERGFAGVSVQEIAERVDITAGAVYRHFPSKEAILDAVLLQSIDAWIEAAGNEAAVERVVDASVQVVIDRPGELATYVRERHRADGPTRRVLVQREAVLSRRWSDAILAARPGLSPADRMMRQQAVTGVLSSLARRPAGLGQQRRRALVTGGLLAVVTLEGPAPVAAVARTAPSWPIPIPRREQIVDVAMGLFADRGYHGVGMDDLGEAVGLSGPSLYEHVTGKAEILVDAYDRAGSFVTAGAAVALASSSSAADALERLVRSYVEVAQQHVALIVVTSREGAALPAEERSRLARRRRDLHEQWAAVLRELRPDVSPSEARFLVRAALALVLTLARQDRDGKPSIDATTALVRAFLLGSPDTSPSRPEKIDGHTT